MSTDARCVLVTDAHSNPALAAVRSLGQQGFTVAVVAEEGRLNLAGVSRFASRVVVAPRATEKPSGYAQAVLDELGRERYGLLLPVTDTTVAIVSHRRAEFDALTRVALPDAAALRYALDKMATVQIAGEAAVAVPSTWTFESVHEALSEAARLPYPCVVKPRYSRRWNGDGSVREGRVRFAGSPEDFRALYPRLHDPAAPPLVQEFVRGAGAGVFALVDHGRVLTSFVHRRVREVSPTGGPASLAESVPAHERLVAPARRLLERAAWHGVAMVEFKDRGEPHSPYLMEMNGRLWGSLPLAIAAGMDFPRLLAELFLGEVPRVPSAYRVGVRCRHLRGDLSHLGGVLRGARDGWPDAFPGKLRTLAAIAPWPGRWQPYNMRWTDPWPALVESWDFIKDECRAAAGRIHRTQALEARP